jgi:leader peptidase (prepilin peptidase)/N-methyltransferase
MILYEKHSGVDGMLVVAYAVVYGFVFLFGICIGSFLNVLIYRIPLNLNPAKGRSFCPNCHNKLLPRDLVPLFSFIVLRGRCRFCGCRISPRYPLVETIGGVEALLAVFVYGLTLQALIVFAALCVLTTVAFIDIDTQEIPDRMHIVLLGLGICAVFAMPEVALMSRIIGIFAVSVPMILLDLIVKGSFGGGDIKLCAACGFLLGWRALLVGTFIAVIGGGVYGVFLLATKKKGRKAHFAFGPFLALGMAVGLLTGDAIWYAYLAAFGL